MGYIQDLGMKAQACKSRIATASTMEKNDALLEIAFVLRRTIKASLNPVKE